MKKLWNGWKKIAEKIGNFQFKIFFSILYFLILIPLGLLTRKQDFLAEKGPNKWEKTKDNTSNIKLMERQ